MASGDFYVNTFTATTAVPYLITSTGSGVNVNWAGGGAGGVGGVGGISYQPSYSLPPAKPLTALEWLDAEIEKTCALARAA